MSYIAKRTATAFAALTLVSALGVAVAQSEDPVPPPADPAASTPLTEPMSTPLPETTITTPTPAEQTTELPPRADRG